MKIIDAHAHIFPKKLAKVATEATRDFYDMSTMNHIGTTEELLKSGGAAGVTRFVVFSTATSPEQVVKINDFIIGEAAARKELIGVGTMHRDFEDFDSELTRLERSGIRGIKLHPDFQRFNIDDPRLFPVFESLQKRDMFVITHSGDFRYDYSHPARVARVAKRFPYLRIVAAHFGGWSKWDTARRELRLPNIFVDTSSTYGFVGTETVRKGISAFGEGHVFFGCDFPMWSHKDELEMLFSLRLPERVLEDVLYNNFAAFLR